MILSINKCSNCKQSRWVRITEKIEIRDQQVYILESDVAPFWDSLNRLSLLVVIQ